MQGSNEEKSFEQYKEEYISQFYGAVAFLVILLGFGIVGNSLVLYIYSYKMKASTQRVFVLTMAVLDMCTCGFGIPVIIYTFFDSYTFDSVALCKMIYFVLFFCVGNSGNILLVIAVHRYQKTCRPFGWQITQSSAKWVCLVVVCLGCLFFWPAFVFYGKRTIILTNSNVTGICCNIDDTFVNSPYPRIWSTIIGIIVFVDIIGLICVYFKIWRFLSKHSKQKNSKYSKNTNVTRRECEHDWTEEISTTETSLCISETAEKSSTYHGRLLKSITQRTNATESSNHESHLKDESGYLKETKQCHVPGISNQETINCSTQTVKEPTSVFEATDQPVQLRHIESSSRMAKFNNGVTPTISNSKPKAKQEKRRSNRRTLMFFVLTLVYILTFVPYFATKLAEDLLDSFDFTSKALYHIVNHFALINSAVNCYIYCFFDVGFQEELKRMLGKQSPKT